MNYTHSITSKGQITLPKEFREQLGLDKIGKATIELNTKGQIVITAPKTLEDIRRMLAKPTFADPPSEKDQMIGDYLARKYGVR